jgi:hypothetical protein
MDKNIGLFLLLSGLTVGISIFSLLNFENKVKTNDNKNTNYIIKKEQKRAEKLVVNFFVKELRNNPDLTLEEAILRFEDPHNKYKNMEDFVKLKDRTIQVYIDTYKKMYNKAKKNIIKKN